MSFLFVRRERVRAAGGEVGRLNIVGGAEVMLATCSTGIPYTDHLIIPEV